MHTPHDPVPQIGDPFNEHDDLKMKYIESSGEVDMMFHVGYKEKTHFSAIFYPAKDIQPRGAVIIDHAHD